jgi:hypothetical protein
LRVTNSTDNNQTLQAFWIDYQGKFIDKGSFGPNETWTQLTFGEHPWVFCDAETNAILVYYVPYRVIPATRQELSTTTTTFVDASSVTNSNQHPGVHQFSIHSPRTTPSNSVFAFACHIQDPVLPYPASETLVTMEHALDQTLLHCHRLSYKGWSTLIQYLTNIVQHPKETKFRRLRMANPIFSNGVWMTPAKGLLLALGFVEHGAFVELGTSNELSRERVQDVARLLYHLGQWKEYSESSSQVLEYQPLGMAGYRS